MNDILKELLEEFPELKEDSEKLEKVVDYLQKSKPSVEASVEFKESLRSRLDNIIAIRQGKKNNLGKILIPVFSFCLIVALVFVYYTDFSNVENKGQNYDDSFNQSLKMSSQGVDESLINTGGGGEEIIVSSDQLRIENEDNIEIFADEIFSDGPIIPSSFSAESLEEDTLSEIEEIIKESEDMLKSQPSILETGDAIHSLKNSNEENLGTQETVNVKEEIDDVMSLLDDLFKGIDMEGEAASFGLIENENNYSNVEITEDLGVYSFEQYCKDNKGIIVETAYGMTCRKAGTECKKEAFNGTSCEFAPLN